MRIDQKNKLIQVADVLERASETICEVKCQRRGVKGDDDYWALEDLEVRLDSVIEDLKGHCNN